MSQMLELPEPIYQALLEEAQASGKTPAAWIAEKLLEEDDNQVVPDMYLQVMEVFGREGWDDPGMDIYNDLDPRRQA